MNKTAFPLIGTMFLLAGCGGGGGGNSDQDNEDFSSSLQITRENANEVIAAGVSAGEVILQLADPLALVSIAKQQDEVDRKIGIGDYSEQLIRYSLDRIAGSTLNPVDATGVVVNNTINCDEGNFLFTANDINANNKLDSGETAGFNYNDCKTVLDDGGFTISNGAVTVSDVLIQGDPSIEGSNWRLAFKADYDAYSAGFHDDTEDLLFTIEFEGDIGLDIGASGNGVTQFRSTSISDFSVGLIIALDGSSAVRSLRDYSEKILLNTSTSEITREFDGILADTSLEGNGRVKIETIDILRGLSTDEHYSEGKNRFTGANNSSALLTIIDNNLVRLEIDEDGNGVAEIVDDYTWDEL